MKFSVLSFLLLAACLIGPVNADIAFIDFEDDGVPHFGTLIDGLTLADIGTPAATFAVLDGPDGSSGAPIPGLTISFTGITAAPGDTNIAVASSSIAGLGVDSDNGTSGFFEPGESVSFQFNQAVNLNSIEFFSLSVGGDTIAINGTNFTDADETGSSDVIDFTTTAGGPIFIPAGTNLTFASVAGTIGVENITIETVPEPASAVLLAGIGVLGLSRRRR